MTVRLHVAAFAILVSTLTLAGARAAIADEAARCVDPDIHVVAATHGTATGWLVGFGAERNYMVNNYADLLSYAGDNPFSVALSEAPTFVAMRELEPGALAAARAMIAEGRADVSNVFYLETSVNLTQGETLLRIGLEGVRWAEYYLGVTPRIGWTIDTVGIHRQLPELLWQLGSNTFVYGRNPPLAEAALRWRSPSGREALAVYSDGYAHWRVLFTEEVEVNTAVYAQARQRLDEHLSLVRSNHPALWLIGASDYSPAPEEPLIVSEMLNSLAEDAEAPVRACFSTPTAFFEDLHAVSAELPVYEGETLYSYNLFWVSNPRFKQRYREIESRITALDNLASLRSLTGSIAYPDALFAQAWTLLFLNSDRALLWGIGSGDPFYGERSWSANDRFERIESLLEQIEEIVLRPDYQSDEFATLLHMTGRRHTVEVSLDRPIEGGACDGSEGSGDTVCVVEIAETGALTVRFSSSDDVAHLARINVPEQVETEGATVVFDPQTGNLIDIVSPGGVSALGGASVIPVIERQPDHNFHQDFLAPPATRSVLANADASAAKVSAWESPLRVIVESRTPFEDGAGWVMRRFTVWRHASLIDLSVTLEDVPEDAIVYLDYRLRTDIATEIRGLPYGYAERDLSEPTPFAESELLFDHQLLGVHDTIAPAVRWSAHLDEFGVGVAVLDRGTPGRETLQDSLRVMLAATSQHYRGIENAWLSGAGEQRFELRMAPVFELDRARLAHEAREFNTPVFIVDGTFDEALVAPSASENFLIESVRHSGATLEVRGVEVAGERGLLRLAAPCGVTGATRSNALGVVEAELELAANETCPVAELDAAPQEIITIRFDAAIEREEHEPLGTWEGLYPPERAADIDLRDETLVGHPPE